jgi:CRISPR system Cascade subunit CasD
LRVPKDDLNTVLSDRYYYADYASTIGVVGPAELLDECLRALKAPHFTLYLGRKCCAPGWPIDPLRLNAPTWAEALACHDADTNAKLQQFARFGADRWLRASSNVHSLDEQIQPGDLNSIQRSVWRWDEPIDTARRLYANRSHKRFDQQMATSKMESSP